MTDLRISASRVRLVMDMVATVAAVSGCVLLVWLNWSKFVPPPGPSVPRTPVSLEGASVKGSATAPVVLIEYSDYKCPFCSKAETDILPELTREYIQVGKVQLAFRQHPLEQLHPGATKAAEAALCAGRGGKFWEMHAVLFKDAKNVDEQSLLARARALELDETSFKACLQGAVVNQVRNDAKQAETLGLTGTPAFLVGTREPDGRVRVLAIVNGARPIADFYKAIDQALATQKRSN